MSGIVTRAVGAGLLWGALALLVPSTSLGQSGDFTVPLPGNDMMIPDDYDPSQDGGGG